RACRGGACGWCLRLWWCCRRRRRARSEPRRRRGRQSVRKRQPRSAPAPSSDGTREEAKVNSSMWSARSLAVSGRAHWVGWKSLGIGLAPRVSGGSGSLDRRPQLGAAGLDRAQALLEARPGPGLDLGIAGAVLAAGRLVVLEPRVGFLDQQQLECFLVAGQAHRAHLQSI